MNDTPTATPANPTGLIVAFSTVPSAEEATRIARHLVETRAAACVSVLPGVASVYRWHGRIEEAAEWLMMIKTSAGALDLLRAELRAVHPYEVPELIVLPILDGLPDYLAWLAAETSPSP